MEGRSLQELAQAVIGQYMDYWQRHGGLIKTVRIAELEDLALAAQHKMLQHEILARVLALTSLLEPRLHVVRYDPAKVRRTFHVIAAAVQSAVERPHVFGVPESCSREQLVEELADIAVRAVGVAPEA